MALQKIIDSVLAEWLPTLWARSIAALTISLSPSSLFLPDLLQSVGLKLSEKIALLIRWTAPPTILFAGTFFVLILVVRYSRSSQQPQEKSKTHEQILLEKIICNILKLRGANEIASPTNISALMQQDTGVIHALMLQFHNEQYMTFQTGGAMPSVDTDFFLSPKAFDIVKLTHIE